MTKTVFKEYDSSKFIRLLGFVFAAFTGVWAASVFAPLVISFAGAGLISGALIKIGFSLIGMFFGAGAYTQFLKEFMLWPMQSKSKSNSFSFVGSSTPTEPTISFRPRHLWQDIKQLLSKFDRELLKANYRVYGEDFYIGKEPDANDQSPMAQFARLLENDGFYKGNPKPHREYFNRLQGKGRLDRFEEINKERLQGIRDSQQNPENEINRLKTEVLKNYKSFLEKLKKTGIIEGTGLVLENEKNTSSKPKK